MTEAIKKDINNIGVKAKAAARHLSAADTAQKNKALLVIANNLEESRAQLMLGNQKDLEAAKQKGLEAALIDRLDLSDSVIDGMINGLKQIVSLPDPVGQVDGMKYVPSGIQIGKMRVPLGVVGIIYESRPNVTIDAAALCLKSGNATILRGGSEAIHSNMAIAKCIQQGLLSVGMPQECVQVIDTVDRSAVGYLITSSDYVDVIVPRGGKGLIERVSSDATVPVIKHLDGNCHVYIDEFADTEKAIAIAYNAKARRYGVCNAMETLLVHNGIAQQVLPELIQQYINKGVQLRGCDRTQVFDKSILAAVPQDWETEFLDAILAIKIVDSMQEAIEHIAEYSSDHTESIVTENISNARQFVRLVDSSSVMVNASTGFADGFEYGLGAEIGISTDKLHVRGPVGLEGLTTQKYVVYGDGHVRS